MTLGDVVSRLECVERNVSNVPELGTSSNPVCSMIFTELARSSAVHSPAPRAASQPRGHLGRARWLAAILRADYTARPLAPFDRQRTCRVAVQDARCNASIHIGKVHASGGSIHGNG